MITMINIQLKQAVSYRHQRGFSLVELMVGLVIGLLMSLVVYNVLNNNENRKRTTTSLNDINQAGSYAMYQLDRYIRSAGSGFTNGLSSTSLGADYTYGCALNMAKGGVTLSPLSSALPAPFDTINTSFKVAPVIIADGAAGDGGDVIITMSGNGGLGELPIQLSSAPSGANLQLSTHVGIRANDIILLTNNSDPIPPCLVQQIASSFVPIVNGVNVPLAGDYYTVISGNSALSYSSSSMLINLGQMPSFNMFAVNNAGGTNALMRYDLMQVKAVDSLTNPNPSIYVDGVYQMHALYGVDDGSGTGNLVWQRPTGNYSVTSLLDSTASAKDKLKRIKAIKVGLVMRTSLKDKAPQSASSITLFADVNSPVTVNLSSTNYRYRAFEAIIPIRNTLFLR